MVVWPGRALRQDEGGRLLRTLPATQEGITEAARLIRAGGLVGMPTETVYGIAANALDPEAVARTFQLKGRPAENPLIVHVSDLDQVRQVARDVPVLAEALAKEFWPGPLTMVLHKSGNVPAAVTAGRETIAVRIPSHVVARELIRQAGVPVSAPSANAFMALSPTSAQDIAPEIAEKLDAVLDGGACDVGIESTVLDLTVEPPALFRPGGLSRQRLEEVIGRQLGMGGPDRPRSPGQYARHYAPRTPVRLVRELEDHACGLTFGEANSAFQIHMPSNSADYARELYKSLRLLDCMDQGEIQVEIPPQGPEWEAVWDRLRKASSRG